MTLQETAIAILSAKPFAELDKELLATLFTGEIMFYKQFCNSIKEQKYDEYTEEVKHAAEKCREDMGQYVGQFYRMQDKIKKEIEELELKEARIDAYNTNVRYNRYDKEQELGKLGFFDKKRKKQLQAELDKWQYKEVPEELSEEIQKKKDILKQIDEHIAPYLDHIKGITWYLNKAEIDQKQAKKKQTIKTPQKQNESLKKPNKKSEGENETVKIKTFNFSF